LVVDADSNVRESLDRLFASLVWERRLAPTTRDGAALLRQQGADLVIVEETAGGEDGMVALVNAARATEPDVPVVFLRAEALVGGAAESRDVSARSEEASELVVKPIDEARVRAVATRLVRLFRERQRQRRRASVLLDVSARLSTGGRSKDLLDRIARAVSEMTPFRRAAIYIAEEPGDTALRAAHHRAPNLPEAVRLGDLVRAFERGYKLGPASFVPGSRVSRPTPPEAAFMESRARRFPAEAGDHALVEIRSPRRLWGHVTVEDPEDGLRPTEDTLKLLSVLAAQVATVLENRTRYDSESLLRSRLEMVRDVVQKALERADLAAARSAMTEAAVSEAGYGFSVFLERHAPGVWTCEAPCPTLDAGTGLMRDLLELQVPGIERGRFLEFNRQSLLLGRSPRVCLAVPVFAAAAFKGFFVVEDDVRDTISETDRAAFQTLCDQMGLLQKRLEHEKELERKTAELQASYSQLEAMHQENLRIQEVLRRYIPPSTWERVDRGQADLGGIEEVRESAVMFVDICGFTRTVEASKPSQVVAMLNAYFTSVATICYQHGGEIVKYIGDGIMGFFKDGPAAVAAVSDMMDAEAKISAQIAEIGLSPIELRAGVAFGPVIVTTVGPFYQQDRTLLGDTVNTASRLERRALPGSALFDSRLIGDRDPASFGLASVGILALRGKKRPVTVLTFADDRARYATGATGEVIRPDARG
jgi:class 3 adenylate cyclase/FixJ family two-component response regulator